MKAPPSRTTVLLVILSLTAGAWAVSQHFEKLGIEASLRAAEARADLAEKKVALLASEKAQRQQPSATGKTEARKQEDAGKLAQKEARREANKEAKRAARMSELTGEKDPAVITEGWVARATDPAVMRRLAEKAQLQTARHYEPLFDQLGLSHETRDALMKLLVDKRQVALDVSAAMMQNGADPRDDPSSYADMVAATREDLENQIHAMLGDAGYQSYQAFDHSLGQSQVIGRLGQITAQMQQPLTATQVAQLQSTMQANNTGRISAKVVTGAQAFLNPAQLQALRDLRAIQQANSKLRNTPTPALPTAGGH